jgi:hypothetical protein
LLKENSFLTTTADSRKINFRRELLIPLGPLLGLALLLRLIPFLREPLINPDGITYILQAKALYLHETKKVLEFYAYPTNLAYLISGVFHLIGDWVLSARLVSLFFSLATTIPLYFLSRLFWARATAITITAFYVVSPLFVELSVNIIRGPEFWFFLCLGLFCFCRFLKTGQLNRRLLCFTAISFLLAGWGRIEGILPLFLAGSWLLLHRKSRKLSNIIAYFLPLIIITCGFISIMNSDIIHALPHGFTYRVVDSINRFQWLRNALTALQKSPPLGAVPYFFSEVKQFLWLLGLGVSANSILKTFGGIFFLITAFGFAKSTTRYPAPAARQPALIFLILLILSGGVIIYIQILLNWCDCERFVALIYFPGLIFAGYGCNQILNRIGGSLPGPHPQVYLLIFLLLISLPKTFNRSHLSHSAVFKEAGEILKNHQPQAAEINLGATSDKIIFTHFYACLDQPKTLNPWSNCTVLKVSELTPEAIINSGYDYLILTERDGGRRHFMKLLTQAVQTEKDINRISIIWEKSTEKYGKVSLFAIKSTL